MSEIIDNLTQEQHRAQIEKLAKKAFAEHVLRRESENSWYCGKPGTRIYSFWIAFLPYHVVMVGDLYSQVYQVSDADALLWLRGSTDSLTYVMEKARHKEMAFLCKEADAALKEAIREAEGHHKQALQALKKEWDSTGDQDDPKWRELWWEELSDSEPPDATDYSSQMLMQYHGLKTFVALYQKMLDAQAAPALQNPARVEEKAPKPAAKRRKKAAP